MPASNAREIPAKTAVPRIADLLANVVLTDEKTFVSQIFDALRTLIVTVELLPGQMISEKEVAEALTASKTPVREALIRLEDAGLVSIVPKSGTYVTPIQVDRYIEACFVRLQLETGAVRRVAAQNGNVAAMAQLTQAMGDQERAIRADDYVRFFQLDEDFHRMLFQIAELSGVWATVKRSQVDMDRVRHLKRLFNIRRGERVIAQHWDIVHAIQSGSAGAAEEALLAHLGSLEREIESLSAHPALLAHIEQLNSRQTGSRARRA